MVSRKVHKVDFLFKKYNVITTVGYGVRPSVPLTHLARELSCFSASPSMSAESKKR